MKETLDKLIVVENLNQNYGGLSCFDYPEEYNRMESLNDEAFEECKEIAGVHGEDLHKVLKTIASEIERGNINRDADIYCYSFDEYVDRILEGYEEETRRVFDELFYFMDSDTRITYIDANYLTNDPGMFASRFLDVIVEVAE